MDSVRRAMDAGPDPSHDVYELSYGARSPWPASIASSSTLLYLCRGDSEPQPGRHRGDVFCLCSFPPPCSFVIALPTSSIALSDAPDCHSHTLLTSTITHETLT